MKFILDANLSPRLSVDLNAAGCDTQHVAELGLLRSSDLEIISYAAQCHAVVITADIDFGNLLMRYRLSKPSILRRGGIIVVEPGSIRQRTLPLTGNPRD